MSSPDAIATVTATLRHLLSSAAASVTAQPPSTARGSETGEQINIFLYGMQYNTAFSNAPLPGESRSGEAGRPPLALILKYMVTSYGANDDDISGQQLMGRAMSILHDHPLLSAADIEGIIPNSRLHQQVERVRIIPDSLSLDDISKLWSSFQTAEYRLSTGYEISVVLIESTRVTRKALPVLKRGALDRGPEVVSGSLPSISGLRFPNHQPSAQAGDVVTVLGQRFAGAQWQVRLQHPQLQDPIDIAPEPSRGQTEMDVVLPSPVDDAQWGSQWPAGFYTLSLIRSQSDTRTVSSNPVAMQLSPQIVSIDPLSAEAANNIVVTIECLPQIREGQTVALLFGERLIAPASVDTPDDPTANTTLTFSVVNAVAKETPYVLRLRVDGVDSIPVDFSGPTPQFAPDQQVTIL